MTSSFAASTKDTNQPQQMNFNLFKAENKENNNLESNILGLLNKHRNQNMKNRTQTSVNNLQANKENLDKLNDKHQTLITNILAEEERYIANHKTHIDEMVEIIKSVNKD